jgi:hypothetical protein
MLPEEHRYFFPKRCVWWNRRQRTVPIMIIMLYVYLTLLSSHFPAGSIIMNCLLVHVIWKHWNFSDLPRQECPRWFYKIVKIFFSHRALLVEVATHPTNTVSSLFCIIVPSEYFDDADLFQGEIISASQCCKPFLETLWAYYTYVTQFHTKVTSDCNGVRIKLRGECEDMWSYYATVDVNLRHVSIIHCGSLQGGVLKKDMLQSQPLQFTNMKFLNISSTMYVVEMTNNMQKFSQLFYSMYRLLHVSAVVCHHQGASGSVWVTWKYISIWWYII